LPANSCLQLQYTYYYNNLNEEFVTPPTLSINDVPNQQIRIDIMNPDSDPFSVAPGDVLENLLLTEPGDPAIVLPTVATFNISAFAGQTIRLRFALANNEFFMNMGVDNVSILPVSCNTGYVNDDDDDND